MPAANVINPESNFLLYNRYMPAIIKERVAIPKASCLKIIPANPVIINKTAAADSELISNFFIIQNLLHFKLLFLYALYISIIYLIFS